MGVEGGEGARRCVGVTFGAAACGRQAEVGSVTDACVRARKGGMSRPSSLFAGAGCASGTAIRAAAALAGGSAPISGAAAGRLTRGEPGDVSGRVVAAIGTFW